MFNINKRSINFEHISQLFSSISLVDFEQVYACLDSLGSYSKIPASVATKMIFE